MGKKSFLADFKAFITKGNVVDMAVGVVIGGSFGKIVTGLVNYIINPFVGIFMLNGDLNEIKTVITPEAVNEAGEVTTKEIAILWGTWLQTVLDFLITALCIFVVLRIIMRFKERLEAKKIAEAAAKAEEEKAKAAAAEAEEKARIQALAERQKLLEDSILNQEKLLEKIATNLNK